MRKEDYVRMQKEYYDRWNDEQSFKDNVVGNYDSQQKYEYERWLLNYNGDINTPLFENTKELVALDYGCGMGRMVGKMNMHFDHTDGVDIGTNLIEYSKKQYPGSEFWVTDGINCGDAHLDYYDFIYSTICMQHICSYDVRMNIWESAAKCLKSNGKVNFQMLGFNDESHVETYKESFYNKHGRMPKFARWKENHFDAERTNSGHDVYIFREDYEMIKEDANRFFKNCKIYEDAAYSTLWNKVFITAEKL
jgi:SAM-dependent methyltransferase